MIPYTIRNAEMTDMEAVARVHIASWRTTYGGLVETSWFDQMERTLDRRVQARRERLPRTDVYTLVMTSPGGLVVGFADVGPLDGEDPRFDGELYAVYLLKGWQGLGGGRALVQAGAAWLAQQGFRSMKVWVLRDNPSRMFYQRLGAEFVEHRPITIGTQTLAEEAYGWRQLNTFV